MRKDTDIEIDNAMRKYMISCLDNGQKFNSLSIDCVDNGNVCFVSWMKFPVDNNFMIFNTILSLPSTDPLLKGNRVKMIAIDKNIVSKLIFNYVSYCDQSGVLIKTSKQSNKSEYQ